MNVCEYGKGNSKTIIFLHGGGLSTWNYREEAERLKDKFHVVVPALNGHSGSDKKFTTIEENASDIIDYIDIAFHGRVFLIAGLSLGGQILVEMLSQRKNICQFAIIESALVLPMKMIAILTKPAFSLCYPLIRKRWFAKMQFKALHLKSVFFEDYFRDSVNIQKADLVAFMAANSSYKIKDSLSNCRAKTVVLVGGKEQRVMKKSARIISQIINDSSFEILPGYYHGDLSINHPEVFVCKLLTFIF